ncbi:PEP-CTERM sorting domain-containing protein [Aquabacterium lacunae]|uniref:PEP-CTERM sorting domain-containing protein n=1 Tax=Aquabacterium lacunae TaxID=2528630 RepID=UPI0013EF0C80|nr:PEP-CTERM sorting domain-containing protein [Aquabacterium lacunae]
MATTMPGSMYQNVERSYSMMSSRSMRALALAGLAACGSVAQAQAQSYSNNGAPIFYADGGLMSVDTMIAGIAAFQTFSQAQTRVLDSWGFEVAGGTEGSVRLSIREVVADATSPVGFNLGQEVGSAFDSYGFNDSALSFNNINLTLGPGTYAAVLTGELGANAPAILPLNSPLHHRLSLILASNDGGLSAPDAGAAYTFSSGMGSLPNANYGSVGASLMYTATFSPVASSGSGVGSGVVAAVPEPSIYALMIASVATVMAVTRRRKS